MIILILLPYEILASDGDQLVITVLGSLIAVLVLSCLGVIFLPRLVAAQRIKDLKDDLDLVRKAKQDYVDAVAAITLSKADIDRKYAEMSEKYNRNLEVTNRVVDENVELKEDVRWLIDQFKAETGKQPPLRLRVVSRP